MLPEVPSPQGLETCNKHDINSQKCCSGAGASADNEQGGEGPPAKGYEELLGQLDLQLTYLWRVHSLDYYAGREFLDTAERSATKRTLRGPRPEEGEQPDEAEGGHVLLLYVVALCKVQITRA